VHTFRIALPVLPSPLRYPANGIFLRTAKEFVNKTCWGEEVKLDVDDMEQYDPHYRILAVVYVNETNLNKKFKKERG
jgi:hypothetical protein